MELCSALAVGGLSPSPALLRQIKAVSDIPVRCLMRTRGGDFLYTPEEIQQMAMEMELLSQADGFVIGCLTPEGYLDKEAMQPLIKAAEGKGLTLHRCIDVSRDPVKTYLDAKELGFDTVLTSGCAGNCLAGMVTIRRLLTLDGPEVLIGAGVKASVIETFRNEVEGAQAFHMSGKTEIESAMVFRREGVPMGLPGMDEWHIAVTSEKAVREAKKVLYR